MSSLVRADGPPKHNLVLCAQCLGDVDFTTRVNAAAAGGFRGIAYRTVDYARDKAAGISDAEMQRLLSVAGIEVVAVGLAQGWLNASLGFPDESVLWHIARLFGPRHVNATLMELPKDINQAIDGYKRLCEMSDKVVGASCVLEFIPYAGLRNLTDALQIVCGANSPNGGLILDLWHLHRTDASAEDVARIPDKLIKSVQIADAAAEPYKSLMQESKGGRCLPGDGVADLAGYLAAIKRTRANPLWEVEILSDEIRRNDPPAVARLLADKSVELLDEADIVPGWREKGQAGYETGV